MLVVKQADHVTTAVSKAGYPETGLPEIAMAGRSNVGKSSLINALVNRKSLARVGATPGKTKVINFYHVNESLMLVDLPGYGYAKVSKEEQKSWGKLAEEYLTTRDTLVAIILMLDIRHEPTGDDAIMLEFIKQSGHKLVVVASKADKLNRSEITKHVGVLRQVLHLDAGTPVIPFSALKRTGVEALWQEIETAL